MREITAGGVTQTISRLCIEAVRFRPDDVLSALQRAEATETSPVAIRILGEMLENEQISHDVETYQCHVAGLPVAVNLQRHSARSKSAEL